MLSWVVLSVAGLLALHAAGFRGLLQSANLGIATESDGRWTSE